MGERMMLNRRGQPVIKLSHVFAAACAIVATQPAAGGNGMHGATGMLVGETAAGPGSDRPMNTGEVVDASADGSVRRGDEPVHDSFPDRGRPADPQIVGLLGGNDCSDNDAQVYPGHPEIVGNGHDDDCDGLADEDVNNNPSSDTLDFDNDGFSLAMGDCDDNATGIHPGAAEIVGNLVDDDCDGMADEDAANHPSTDTADHDGDQFTIAPDVIFVSGFEPGP